MSYIGQSVHRLEDPPLLTGDAHFVADVDLPGMVAMRVVRSPVAHGRLVDIDVVGAATAAGVIAVFTASDLDLPTIECRMTRVGGLDPYLQPVLARDRVRYVGEPIAVVIAENAYLAEDAAELVWAEIEDLPPQLDPLRPGEFDEGLTSDVAIIEKGYGDIDDALQRSHRVIEVELRVGRHTGVPMETRGAIGTWDPGSGVVRMYGAAKVPHYNRSAIAKMLRLSLEEVQLHENHVGGGFGVRGELYPEDVLVCAAARRLGRPVRWIEDRREHLIATNHSRDQVHRARVGFDDSGFINVIDDEFWQDQGAYVRTHGATVADLTGAMLPGPYLVPAYRSRGHVVLTNKTPAGTYRSPGRYESSFVRERILDLVASELGMDPVETRRMNLIPADQVPFDRQFSALATNVVYDSGDYERLLDRVLERLDYQELRANLARRRAEGELVGLGVACFVEKSGLGPFDEVRVEVDSEGSVEVITGAASVGQGVETSIAQICADGLGIDLERVRVTHGQTDRIDRGMGAFATRVTVMTGSATSMAAAEIREKMLDCAARLLEASPADLNIERDRFHVVGSPEGPSLTFGEVAAAVFADGDDLTATAVFNTDHMTYPYGVHAALVEIDPATAGCRVVDFLVGYDIGRSINPMLVEGQLVGGVAQGIGGALLEAFRYDEAGQPLATSFMDYLLPTATETPHVEVMVSEDSPSPLNPIGVKGAGEGGVNAVGAAIAAAVGDALGRPEAVTQLPITPASIRDVLADLRSVKVD